MKVSFDTEWLNLFKEPVERWELHKRGILGKSYSNLWRIVEKYVKLGLVEKVGTRRASRNPVVQVPQYLITERGLQMLDIFQ